MQRKYQTKQTKWMSFWNRNWNDQLYKSEGLQLQNQKLKSGVVKYI